MAVLQHRVLKSASCLLKQRCMGCVNRSPRSSEKALWAPPHLLGNCLTWRSAEDLKWPRDLPISTARQHACTGLGTVRKHASFRKALWRNRTMTVESRTFTVLPHLWVRALFETKTMAVTRLELGALKHERTEILSTWNVYSLMLEIWIFVRNPDCEFPRVSHVWGLEMF